MPLPSFTFTGSIFDILGNVAASELVENGFGSGTTTPAKVTFTPNIPINQFVTWSGHAERVKPVVATVNSDGELLRNGDTVRLLANDPGLSVSGVQYRVDVVGMKSFSFDAPEDGDTVDFATVVPVAYVGALAVTKGDDGDPVDSVTRDADDLVFEVQGDEVGRVDISDFVVLPSYYFDVKDPTYGAVGDLVADDTAAIQAALDAAAVDGGTVFFPAGKYRITSSLTLADCPGMTIDGPRSGLIGSFATSNGAWLVWDGGASDWMVDLASPHSVTWKGVGLNCDSVAGAVRVTSDNTPIAQSLTFREFMVYRPTTSVYLNDSGASTQSDQIIFESVDTLEAVNTVFHTNSDNVSCVLFSRCTSSMASSDTDTVHYRLDRGGVLRLEDCSAGFGQDMVRIGGACNYVVLDSCQIEGSAHGTPSLVNIPDPGFGNTSPVELINCVADHPIRIAQDGRKINSIGTSYPVAATGLYLSGDGVDYVGVGDYFHASATKSVTGTGATMVLHDEGKITWNGDTNLYRDSANLLKTDDNFNLLSNLFFGAAADASINRTGPNTLQTENLWISGAMLLGPTAEAVFISGTGDPNGVHARPRGSVFLRTDGGAGTTFYVKESGTGTSGWVAK